MASSQKSERKNSFSFIKMQGLEEETSKDN